VVVLESDGRTGGRLHTVRPPEAPHLRAEIGGMRYLDSQRLVVALIAALGLAHRDFTMLDDHDLHLLRGSRFTVADLRAGAAVPYDLAPAERGHTPQELMGTVVRALVPDIATIDAAARRARERDLVFGGRPVRDVAMVEVARQVLSPEGFEYVMDGLGYTVGRDPEVGAVNVLHTDYSVGRPRTLTDGMQALPDALAAAAAEAGAEIRRGVRALAVDHGPDGLLRVATDGADPVVARHVVLALPRAALAALDLSTGPLAGSTLAADLDAVLAVPAAKLYLGFPEPWWERLGIMTGKSVTDLPMRQCLYFGVEDEAAGGEAGNRSALLAATYTDDRATGYWQALRDAGGPAWPAADPALPAPTGMVADARRQLAELHGVDVPEPGWAAFRDWTEPPFGGGWHYWRTGPRPG
jgi:monoamine oxidase